MKNKLIAGFIKKYITENNVVFVFPSEIAARMWQEKALDFLPEAVIPDERFTAWDQFKRENAEKSAPGYTVIPECAREFYAEDLLRRNREEALAGKEPLLKAVIPPEFAAKSSFFSSWISNILPQLESWSEKASRPPHKLKYIPEANRNDGETRDLDFIKADYRNFLDRHRILESSWSRNFSGSGGKKYIILFFEAIEDFSDYCSALQPSVLTLTDGNFPEAGDLPRNSAVTVPPFAIFNPVMEEYGNFREEFKYTALKIEKLLMDGENPGDIAVSLNNTETNSPYFTREFDIRGIPYTLRSGYILGKGKTGRVFSLIRQCSTEDFSFRSLKNLVYLKTLPWKSPGLPEKLIQFGIENHCVSSWREKGEKNTTDIWETAFKISNSLPDSRLTDWYRKLKKSIKAITSAKTFSGLRTAWFIFRNDFLDITKMREEDNRELSRCIEELAELSELEKEYSECIPEDPVSFFINRLNKKIYVPKKPSGGGVSIFPYRVAAGTPFKFHFVAGVSQEDSTVLYQQLKFLRKDKREQLLAQETDASDAFFSLYLCGAENVFFSSSRRSADGYKTPHNAFYRPEGSTPAAEQNDLPRIALPEDPFLSEEEGKVPSRIYPVQKTGYQFYSAQQPRERFSFLRTPFSGNCSPETISEIKNRISRIQITGNGSLRVSSMDLKNFSGCGAKWFLAKIADLKREGFSAELIDERQLGLVFHSVLKNIYEFIQKNDKTFLSSHLDMYMKEASRFAEKAALENIDFKGPLTAPILSTLTARITEGVAAVLLEDAGKLDNFIPALLEGKLSFESEGMEFFGIIDRMSVSRATGDAVIIDYKSGSNYPRYGDYEVQNGKMNDFQIPLYILLAENSRESPVAGRRIQQAWIFSIRQQKYIPVLNDKDDQEFSGIFNSRTKSWESVEEFKPSMDALKKAAEDFRQAVTNYNFTSGDFDWKRCAACEYNGICRQTYSVKPAANG